MPDNEKQGKKKQAAGALIVGTAYSYSMYANLINKPRYVRHTEVMSKTRKEFTINW
jgi:hypothetical protein